MRRTAVWVLSQDRVGACKVVELGEEPVVLEEDRWAELGMKLPTLTSTKHTLDWKHLKVCIEFAPWDIILV